MKEDIKISVVTIVYNGEEFIKKTIKSVINQNYKNVDFIVIDGKSTDNTMGIITNYADSITKIISEEDDGIYNAMNKGLSHATGDFVIFMNGGDSFYDDNVLEKFGSNISKLKQLPDFVYGDCYYSMHDQLFYKKSRNHKFNWYGMFASHQAMFYNMDLIRKHSLKFDETYRIAADYKFTLEFMSLTKKIYCFSIPICIFSVDGVSNLNKNLGLEEAQRVRKEVLGYSNFQNTFVKNLLLLSRQLSEKLPKVYNVIRYTK
ncbi:glycosyltransferase family 2 protein [uncultured Chryseobacterium sp.]|uniref:glycosyltransferase family 2 protein n=1 Tax=uncultured Chryseobacterium sp. TaxID=259322 RepID=UPI002601FD7A|nr:glycosyltransferase family 2 protein [uncultured Chryseobacterium sp.]